MSATSTRFHIAQLPLLNQTNDFVFKINLTCFWHTLILSLSFFITQLNNFPGDLTNVSAKTKTLVSTGDASKVSTANNYGFEIKGKGFFNTLPT